jgi:RNA polymerase-binding transcription factor DksA
MSEQLSPEIVEEVRAALEHKRGDLQQQIQAIQAAREEQAQDPMYTTGLEADIGDMGADLTEWERQQAIEAGLRSQLAEVEHAMAKLDRGTYGLCEQCGRPIPLPRRRRIPEARYDLEHQAALESRGGARR